MSVYEVKSSNIVSVEPLPNSKKLVVVFHRRSVAESADERPFYVYENVEDPVKVVNGMLAAPSIGSFFSRHVKNVYKEFKKVSGDELTALRSKESEPAAEKEKFELPYGDVQYPHCDGLILHAPGECEFCDRHPDWQQARVDQKINFTGHHDEDKATCPAEVRRPLETINRWGGNVASK